jgi:hypothetical protein
VEFADDQVFQDEGRKDPEGNLDETSSGDIAAHGRGELFRGISFLETMRLEFQDSC